MKKTRYKRRVTEVIKSAFNADYNSLRPKKKRSSQKPKKSQDVIVRKIPAYYFSNEWKILRFDTLARDNHTCRYCGEHAIQADHVTPRSKGGPDTLDNLVACCTSCNRVSGGNYFADVDQKRSWIREMRGIRG
jgi:5-methylcytosine-specific restriction endonuclease McrA